MKSDRKHQLILVAALVFSAAAVYQMSSQSEFGGAEVAAGSETEDRPFAASTPASLSPEPVQAGADVDETKEEPAPPDTAREQGSVESWEPLDSEEEGLPSDPVALALGALDFPDMKGLDPDDPSYDPKLEAQQAFAPMEQDLLAADPLDGAAWRAALERHKIRNLSVSKRAKFLRESGHPDLAEDLLIEWGQVYGAWQARAYGRAGPPGYKSPRR